MTKRAPSTELIHHPYRAPEGWDAVPVPVAKASTVLFKDTADLHKPRPRDGLTYRYGLHGTPTSYTLAARIATLEQRRALPAGAQRPGGGDAALAGHPAPGR